MASGLPLQGAGGAVQFTVDTRGFSQALTQLASMSKRGVTDAINDNMADLFLTASSKAVTANKATVRAVASEKWWPAFISKVIQSEKGYDLKFRRKAKTSAQRNVQWVDTPTGRVMRGRDTMTVYRRAQIKKKALRGVFSGKFKGQSDADAKRVSASIIRRRVATVGAMKATLGWVATKFAPWKVNKFYRKNLRFSRVTPASVSQAFAEALVKFSNDKPAWVNSAAATSGRPSPSADVQRKAQMAMLAINQALPIVTQRMRAAIEKKLDRAAAQAFGRAA